MQTNQLSKAGMEIIRSIVAQRTRSERAAVNHLFSPDYNPNEELWTEVNQCDRDLEAAFGCPWLFIRDLALAA